MELQITLRLVEFGTNPKSATRSVALLAENLVGRCEDRVGWLLRHNGQNHDGEKYCTISINSTHPCDCDTLDQFDTSTQAADDRDKTKISTLNNLDKA